MNRDDKGVAGFFEDLPVLMFVLIGVISLVLSGIWVARSLDSVHGLDELESFAEMLVDGVLSRLVRPETPGLMSSVAAAQCLDVSGIARDIIGERHCMVSIIARFPYYAWLNMYSDNQTDQPNLTGYCSRLLSAADGQGRTTIVEVRAVVW